MKKIFFVLLSVVTTFACFSCGSDDEVNPSKEPGKESSKPVSTKFGTAKATINGSQVDVKWVQLWKDGPKFAEYNVGVTDGKAESYGGYYAWGGSIDKDPNGAYNKGSDALTGTDDTATNLWGNNWRMPTEKELMDLLDNCDKKLITVNGVKGYKFTGKDDYKGTSVFLPNAGQFNGNCVMYEGYEGYCWSSTPNGSDGAQYLYYSGDSGIVDFCVRFFGFSVRAVLAE